MIQYTVSQNGCAVPVFLTLRNLKISKKNLEKRVADG